MISGRSLAQDASTPWKRIRCNRGRGTSAASRCMNSSGDITIWADSSLPCEHHLPGPVKRKPFIGNDGSSDVAAQCCILGAPANPSPWLWSFLR